MRRTIKMEDILTAGQELIRKWAPIQSPNTHRLICSNNTKYGEVLFSKEAAETILNSSGIDPENKEVAVHQLNKRFTGPLAYPESLFVELKLIRQCHLFLRLNRHYIYSKFIAKITTSKETYGSVVSPNERQSIAIVPHVLYEEHVTPGDMTLSDARSLLVAALVHNVLALTGHSVKIHPKVHKDSTQLSSFGQAECLFKPFLSEEAPKSETDHQLTMHEFVCSFLPEASKGQSSRPTDKTPTQLCNVTMDAKTFTAEHRLQGKSGYDKNIDKIQVTNDCGQLSRVACVSHDICAVCLSDHMILYVAPQARSHRAQQAMILADMCTLGKSPLKQHMTVTAAVDVVSSSGKTLNFSVCDLFRLRQQQMADAFSVKYKHKLTGDQLGTLSARMSEAVIKFELLSHDPSSHVKLEVPEQQSVCNDEVDVRFDGAFVLYNYARVATLLNNHKLGCERGTYPPLPAVDSVDFALLKEEEEWQLMFLYVLQWPLLVKDAAQLTKRGVGVHVNLGLKKVCQFLTKFSHAFSSYYGRTKVLMPPEAHLLPLIHARLYLMLTVKQVMYNALKLLGIEPLEQL